jgi:hypothetical protein
MLKLLFYPLFVFDYLKMLIVEELNDSFFPPNQGSGKGNTMGFGKDC